MMNCTTLKAVDDVLSNRVIRRCLPPLAFGFCIRSVSGGRNRYHYCETLFESNLHLLVSEFDFMDNFTTSSRSILLASRLYLTP